MHVAYGYGLFTGGLGAHYGAERLGLAVIPLGGGMSERQVQLIADFKPDIIMVTPSYMLAIADEMERQGLDPKKSSLRVGIFGAEPWTNELRKQIEGLGVGDRVELLGFVSADELLDLYAHCRAAFYVPLNEDYGYVTVEATLSRKPVLTTLDSGGPLEFVTDDVTGLVAEPSPEALADAIDRLWRLPAARLAEMGRAGLERVAGISWDHVIDTLTEGLR